MSNNENNIIKDDESKEEVFQNPFGLPPVDPLVFRQGANEIAPELRSGASKLPISKASEVGQLPPPPKPSRKKYTEWIPGGKVAKVESSNFELATSPASGIRTTLRRVAALLAVLIPFSVIIYLVHLVMNLYHK